MAIAMEAVFIFKNGKSITRLFDLSHNMGLTKDGDFYGTVLGDCSDSGYNEIVSLVLTAVEIKVDYVIDCTYRPDYLEI